jgi:hypothetical protein
MIYRLEFGYGDALEHLLERAEPYMASVRIALRTTGFEGHVIWPSLETASVVLIAEGEDDVEALSAAIASYAIAGLGPAGEARIDGFGHPPGEIDALPTDERWQEIVKLAAPRPGETCGECNGVVPWHLSHCPWTLERHGDDPEREKADQGTGPGDLEPAREQEEVLTAGVT